MCVSTRFGRRARHEPIGWDCSSSARLVNAFGLDAKLHKPLRQTSFIKKLALPHDFNVKPEITHGDFLTPVAGFVSGDLVAPPPVIRFRKSGENTRFVSMPEAPVNENTPATRPIDNVWSTGKTRGANAESHT
jgi:hypothetical protein